MNHPSYVRTGWKMDSSKTDGKVPHTLSVQEAATLISMNAASLRGAIQRGNLRVEEDDEGDPVVRSYNLGAFHFSGDTSHYPEEKMGPETRVIFHAYLETMCG